MYLAWQSLCMYSIPDSVISNEMGTERLIEFWNTSEETPVHSILYIITIPIEKVKNSYERNRIQTLERVYKHYYYIIRAR